jgi:hypothetical protein
MKSTIFRYNSGLRYSGVIDNDTDGFHYVNFIYGELKINNKRQ